MVRHTASLARLSLTSEACAALAPQLAAIVRYLDALDALASGASPLDGAPTPLDGDVAAPSLPRDAALAAAPVASETGFVVPQFVGDPA